MSQNVPQETLMSIPPDELLVVHSQLLPPAAMSKREIERYLGESRSMYLFGYQLWRGTASAASWEEERAEAIKAGWNRVSLSALKWLRTAPLTEEKSQTQLWLQNLGYDFPSVIDDEVNGIFYGSSDPDTVAVEAEAEIEPDFPAFAALSAHLEVDMFERHGSIVVATAERLGAALTGLALKRQLAKVEVAELEQLFRLKISSNDC